MSRKWLRKLGTISSIGLTLVLAMSLVASGRSTTKSLSTNFTLVNLNEGSNQGTIQFYKESTGTQWRNSIPVNFSTLGESIVYRQYTDNELPSGAGSVVVGSNGPMGAVVQIRAIGQIPTSGAYVGARAGSEESRIPLVARRGTSASGTVNSQIVVQNTGPAPTTVTVDLINRNTGAVQYTKSLGSIPSSASVTYDLDDEANLPAPFFGSAVVKAGTGGTVAVVSNLFLGSNGMQVFNGFASATQKWVVPLFTSRLPNNLSTVVVVQNLSGGSIPAQAIKLQCVADATSSVQQPLNVSNPVAVGNNAPYEFNPVSNTSAFPAGFQGSCTVDTTGYDTAVIVQMRFIGTDNAAAYEAIPANVTQTKLNVPIYLKLGPPYNGFATVTTIANLGSQKATVRLTYKGNTDVPAGLNCNPTPFTKEIEVGGSIQQNMRVPDSNPNAVPQIPTGCQGSLTVESTNGQPIVAFVQITNVIPQQGDTYMAHDAFNY